MPGVNLNGESLRDLVRNNEVFQDNAIQDMMGKPPGWLLRSGLSIMAAVVLVSLSLTAIIRYPDNVKAGFLIQSETIPLELAPLSISVIDTIVLSDGMPVQVGDTLMVFRSETSWRPILSLNQWLDKLENQYPPLLGPPKEEYPGSIQNAISSLVVLQKEWKSYLESNSVGMEIRLLQKEIEDNMLLNQAIDEQLVLFDQELNLQQEMLTRIERLAAERINSEEDLESASRDFIAAKRQRAALASNKIQNEMRIHKLRQQILSNKALMSEKNQEFERLFEQGIGTLTSVLSTYRKEHFLIADQAGYVSWRENIRPGQSLNAKEVAGYILPSQANVEPIAHCKLPALNQGKLKLGDRVLLNLDAFPAKEFGQLEGVLTSIAPIASVNESGQTQVLATISLPDSLMTTYQISIPFRHNLSGEAKIIAADRSLLSRVFDQVLNISKNN